MAITYFPDDVTILGGDLVLGNTGPSPASGTPVKGTATLQPAGNTTAGELILQAKTGAGTLRSTTLKNSTSSAADQTYTLPVNYPAVNGYLLSCTTAGVMSWVVAAGGGTVGGSGTDNHIARFDGTGNIQDSGWVIADTSNDMSYDDGSNKFQFTSSFAGGTADLLIAATNTGGLSVRAYSDSVARIKIDQSGALNWGSGSGATDTVLTRIGANLLAVDSGDALAIRGGGSDHASTTDGTLYYRTDTDVLRLRANGAWVSLATGTGSYTDEEAQDAVGAMIADTTTIDLTYTDATPELKADVKANSIDVTLMHATATDKLFGRSTAGAGAGEEIACTAAGRAILDDANAAAQLVTLGAQPLDTQLTAIAALADASGALTNDGAGNFSYVAGGSGLTHPQIMARTMGG